MQHRVKRLNPGHLQVDLLRKVSRCAKVGLDFHRSFRQVVLVHRACICRRHNHGLYGFFSEVLWKHTLVRGSQLKQFVYHIRNKLVNTWLLEELGKNWSLE